PRRCVSQHSPSPLRPSGVGDERAAERPRTAAAFHAGRPVFAQRAGAFCPSRILLRRRVPPIRCWLRPLGGADVAGGADCRRPLARRANSEVSLPIPVGGPLPALS